MRDRDGGYILAAVPHVPGGCSPFRPPGGWGGGLWELLALEEQYGAEFFGWFTPDERNRLEGIIVSALRSRVQPNGRIQVLLDDVLYRREVAKGVGAIGGDFLTEDEFEELHRSRLGTLPWEREPATRTR